MELRSKTFCFKGVEKRISGVSLANPLDEHPVISTLLGQKDGSRFRRRPWPKAFVRTPSGGALPVGTQCLGPTVRSLDFSTLTYDSLYAAVRGVDDSHRLLAASPSTSMALAAAVTPAPSPVPSVDFPCDICQSPTHWSPACPERHAPDARARQEARKCDSQLCNGAPVEHTDWNLWQGSKEDEVMCRKLGIALLPTGTTTANEEDTRSPGVEPVGDFSQPKSKQHGAKVGERATLTRPAYEEAKKTLGKQDLRARLLKYELFSTVIQRILQGCYVKDSMASRIRHRRGAQIGVDPTLPPSSFNSRWPRSIAAAKYSLVVCLNPVSLDNLAKAYRSILAVFAAEVSDGAPSPYQITPNGISVYGNKLEFRSKVFMFASRGNDYSGETFREFVGACPACQTSNSTTQKTPGLLHPLSVPTTKFADIGIDFVGPLPESRGFDYLIVITDRLTGWVVLIPTVTTLNLFPTSRGPSSLPHGLTARRIRNWLLLERRNGLPPYRRWGSLPPSSRQASLALSRHPVSLPHPIPVILDGTGHRRRPWPRVQVRGPSVDPLSTDQEAHYEAGFHSLQYLPDDVVLSVAFNIEGYLMECYRKRQEGQRSLFKSLGFAPSGPTRLNCDNKSTIHFASHPSAHQRTKHIDIKYHKIRECIAHESIVSEETEKIERVDVGKFLAKIRQLIVKRTVKAVQGRLDTLRKDFVILRHLREQSGFGWDPELQVVTTDEAVWEDMPKKYRVWKNVPFPYYDVSSEQRQLGEGGGDLAFEGEWESDHEGEEEEVEEDPSRRAKVAKDYRLCKDGSVETLKKLTAAGRLIMMKAGIMTLDKTFLDWNNGNFQQKLNTEHYQKKENANTSPLPRTPSLPPSSPRPSTPPLPPPVTTTIDKVTVHRHSTLSRWDSFPPYLIQAIHQFWASVSAPPLRQHKPRALANLPPPV
ncbi:hypothetical protein L198_04765 [Cryptococcus wingfieldii CBS 7118]|uniref:Myb/SANT-like domain-containing protein n=1 Tax=Cryptococcus wingfieldii CBS 7118 TaxID=1295528 RepID=A0A1E3J3D8_9TREE|nr:hypothetical protein L198_04765 [Cryptococcus wingfieldii CBS 7118]ODN95369.1 hypothetical protein L198_04765 [Cryptococcus wingfieldii CBS 7118]